MSPAPSRAISFEAAHDIDVCQGPATVFAAFDGGDVAAVEADQQDRGRHPGTARTQGDLRLAVIVRERDHHHRRLRLRHSRRGRQLRDPGIAD